MISKADLDRIKTLFDEYGDSWEAYYAAAECMYIEEHKRLPEWACFIESFEYVNGSFIFVHRDPEAAL